MGLMDMLTGGDDPAQQQGMTALAAGLLGGGSFNEALSRGVTARQAAINDYTKQQFMKTQLDSAKLDQQMKLLQMQRMGDAAKVLQQMQSGAPTGAVPVGKVQPGQAGSGTMGIQDPAANQTGGVAPSDYLTLQYRASQGDQQAAAALQSLQSSGDQFRPTQQQDQWAWLRNATPQQLMALKLGNMDQTDLYKLAIEPKSVAAGSYSMLPGQGLTYMPNPKDGYTVRPDGSVGVMPNFTQAAGDIAAATKSGEMRATNQNTLAPTDRINPVTNRPYDMTVDQLINSMNAKGATNNTVPGSLPVNDPYGVIAADIRANGNPNPTMNFKGSRGSVAQINPTSPLVNPQSSSAFQGFRGPDEAARAAADIEVNKNIALKSNDAYQSYKNDLSKGLTNDNQTIARNSFIEPLLTNFTTGKLGQGGALTFSNYIQNSSLPDNIKQWAIKNVGSGDPTTGRFIENQLASAALTTMLQTLDGNGKPNQAIFKALTPAQESIESGNGTLKDVFAAQKYVRDLKAAELQAMAKAEKQPGFDRGNWQAQWADQLDNYVNTKPLLLPSKIAAVPQSDINLLRNTGMNDPENQAHFDATYGKGMAKYFLNGGK